MITTAVYFASKVLFDILDGVFLILMAKMLLTFGCILISIAAMPQSCINGFKKTSMFAT
jgi:hypothetical protein